MPSFQLTIMLLSMEVEFAMGNNGQTLSELMMKVGGSTIEGLGGFGGGLGWALLSPDQVPYSILLIFSK